MSRAIDKGTMLNLIIEAKRTDPETGSFAEWLAEYLVEHLPTLTPPNEWVSVEERLPAPTENLVLVYDCTGVNMAWYSYAMGWMYRTGLPGVEITHWMPLPEPPKEKTP